MPVQIQAAPAWVVILIIGREFAVSGLRSIAAAEGYTIQASDIGKTKMFSQVIAVALLILVVREPVELVVVVVVKIPTIHTL